MKRNISRLFRKILVMVALSPLLYLVWLIIRCFVADYFTIPTNSMFPTLKPGDKVVVNKLIMGARIYTDYNFNTNGGELKSFRLKGYRDVRRNDIVVFNFPHHDWKISFVINNVYCKRALALPGDSLWTDKGYYHNNHYEDILGDEDMQREFSDIPDSTIPQWIMHTYPFDDEHIKSSIKNLHPIYVPRKGDIVRLGAYEGAYYGQILSWELKKPVWCDWKKNIVYADGKPIRKHVFRHNYYFMAGDNVSDSNDSRYWGLVPEDYIVGVVDYVIHKD